MLFLVGALFTSASTAGELPSATLPAPFGVSIHPLENVDQELDLIYSAGFRVVRLDVNWHLVETQRGSYYFSQIDGLVHAIVKRKLRPLLILGFANPLYPSMLSSTSPGPAESAGTATTENPEFIPAFVGFTVATIKHFAFADPIWEIWNEPDNPQFWPSSQNAAVDYTRLADATCQAIRAVDPHATIVGPSASKVPSQTESVPPFLRTFLASGSGACLDGISIHPYLWVYQLDETPVLWSRTRQLISRYQAPEKPMPVPLNTESGVSTFRNSGHGISDETQASYLVRMMLLDVANAIPLSIWYDWRDGGNDPDNPEHRYGVMTNDLHPKAAYKAISLLTSTLSGYHFICQTPNAQNTQLFFSRTTDHAVGLVTWSGRGKGEWKADKTEVVELSSNLTVTSAVGLLGESLNIERHPGKLVLSGGFQPFYLQLAPDQSLGSSCPLDLNN